MKRLSVALLMMLVFSTPSYALDFGNFGLSLEWGGQTVTISIPESFYMLVAGTTDNLTTPTGDRITSPQ